MRDTQASDASEHARRRFAWLAGGTAAATYLLIVFGGIVRITGSGMACGEDWPLCNGRLIPPLDLPTLIEWGHRLFAALVSFLILGLALYALRHRRTPGFAERGLGAWALVSAILLVVQVLVGAVTVRLELPTGTVVLHLIIASALLAALLVAAVRATRGTGAVAAGSVPAYRGWVAASMLVGLIALGFGGLVANTGAAPLCGGFPLCNGQLLPEGGPLIHLHWTHRLLGFAALAVIPISALKVTRAGAPPAVKRTGVAAIALVVTQIGVAAGLVLTGLPDGLQALHLAVGVALWAVLVVWMALAWSTGSAAREGHPQQHHAYAGEGSVSPR